MVHAPCHAMLCTHARLRVRKACCTVVCLMRRRHVFPLLFTVVAYWFLLRAPVACSTVQTLKLTVYVRGAQLARQWHVAGHDHCEP